jgi:hypothetical protein
MNERAVVAQPALSVKTGDRVLHTQRPEWGLGEVVSHGGGKVRVHFVDGGERLLVGAPLTMVLGADALDARLDPRKRKGLRQTARRNRVSEAIARFLVRFPLGFNDPEYVKTERDGKVAAHHAMVEALSQPELATLVAASNFDEVTRRALNIASLTDLILPNEKTALRDGLDSDAAKRRFGLTLQAVLFGPSEDEARFTTWADCLSDIGAARWTTASYFQFLTFPDRCLVIKPIVTQIAADLCNFELSYRAEPNWSTYHLVQQCAQVLLADTAALHPRDMIDVQSFVWSMAMGAA